MLDKAFTNMAIKSGMSKKELVRLLQMNKIDYEQLPEINRMLKYSNLMEKQNGR
jgi:iron only hydrogenase large subunit-like protein